MDDNVRRAAQTRIIMGELDLVGLKGSERGFVGMALASKFESRPLGKLRRSVRRELARRGGVATVRKGDGAPNSEAGQVLVEQQGSEQQ